MAELSRAKLYFRVGVPFENIWIDRISKANTNMRVIDTRRGIKLVPMKAHDHGRHQGHDVRGKDRKDPHIWLSPRLVKLQAQNICNALTAADPAYRAYYRDNLRGFENDLHRLDAEVTEILQGLKRRQFLVFHPTWGYFARDYGLEQVPIEREGKEATAKALASLIDEANEKGIKVIFVQQQFSKKSAETVANAIGGKVVQVDPLSKDYLENMKKIAQAFREVMQMNE
jgi:zinc transport system substrate-binding protein